MFEFEYTDDFEESLNLLERKTKNQILEKLQFFSELKNPLTHAKSIKGFKNIFRFRVGEYRILFRASKQKITLLLVDHRKNIYKGL